MSPVESSRPEASAPAASRASASLVDALRRAAPALGVLACTLVLTFAAWRYAGETVRADEQDRFDRIVAVSREAIDRRLDAYVLILLGVRVLFPHRPTVDRAGFSAYVTPLDLPAS